MDVVLASDQGSRFEPLILVEEISHRVVNEYTQAIAGIWIAAATLTPGEARGVLVKAASRLQSYAEAHRALRPLSSEEDVDLAIYLRRLCDTIAAASLDERGIQLTLTTDEIVISADRGWRVALIVSELITNAVRHGLRNKPGRIIVELSSAKQHIRCCVRDNGIAPSHIKPGRGLTVVTSLASELDGITTWCCEENGTSAEFIFPITPLGDGK